MSPGLKPVLVVGTSYVAGAIPVSNIAARWRSGVDLRDVGDGTVSGTGLYQAAGVRPLMLAGCVELAKGAVGPVLAGDDQWLAAVAGAASIAGHNWSPFLRGAGGRGISVAIGSLLAMAPEGAVVLLLGLVGGRAGGETALGCLIAMSVLPAVLGARRGRVGAATAALLLVPLVAKRLAGNHPPPRWGPDACLNRLLFDRDA